jgi:thiamine biosynthesis lipoprotein
MKVRLLFTLLLISQIVGAQSWMHDFEAAKQEAQFRQKAILLNFSGSDWCIPCIELKKTLFSSEEFIAYATDRLILLNADFPRKSKNRLPTAQQAQKEQLAQQFNPQGNFPMTVLMDAQGRVLKSWKGIPEASPSLFIAAIDAFLPEARVSELQAYTQQQRLMGSRFSITVVGPSSDWAQLRIDSAVAEIQRIEALISSWKPESETSLLNRQAGQAPVRVSKELFELIRRACKVSELTGGAFDLTFGGLDSQIWKFDGSLTQLPDSATAAQSIRLIDYQKILLNPEDHSVLLSEKGMRIGFGAIGKGYAAEQAKAVLQRMGVASGIVNAGGDLTAWGAQPNGQAWTIGIADPNRSAAAFSWLEINDQAVVTSGNYEKYAWIDGVKYSHIVDPRTGYPVAGLQSVTIICSSAELADALATAVYVKGTAEGLALINQLNFIECIIVDEAGNLHTSEGIDVRR